MLQTTMLRKACISASLAFALASSANAEPMGASPVADSSSMANSPVLQENATAKKSPALLDINSATAAELSSVMIGVGLKRAEEIIKLREQLGGFTELEQLLDVKGIGLKTLEKNEALIRIN